MRFGSVSLSLLVCAACALGCERKKPASASSEQDEARREEVSERLSAKQMQRIEDLFAPSPLMDEIVPMHADRSPRKTVERVVEQIKGLREEKGLPLSSSTRPSGSRDAAELARLLVSPAPILESDMPTNDIELVALAVATLRRHGIEATPAVQIADRDEVQLEHLVLGVSFEGTPHEFFELTRDDIEEGARFEVITEVETLGLHAARRAALYYMIGQNIPAQEDLEIALALAPEMATPYYVRTSMTGELDPAQAVKDMSRVALRKNSPEIWLRLGRALRLTGKHENARVILSHIPEGDALYDEAHIELAQNACAQGDKDMFIANLIVALAADPKRWEGWRDLAIVSIVHGDLELADESIRSGIRAAPKIPVWSKLAEVRDSQKPVWHEGLLVRRKMLGACAQAPAVEPVPPEQEESGE